MSTRNKNKRKCQGNTETQPKHHKTEDKNNNALWTVHDDATDSRSDITNENFDKLKPEALSGCRQVRQRVQELEEFIGLHLNVNQRNDHIDRTKSMCSYFVGLNDVLTQFKSQLDQLDQLHIQPIKETVEKVKTLMAKGKQLLDSEKFQEAIGVFAEAEQINETNDNSISIDLLYNRAFAHFKIENIDDAIGLCTRALSKNSDQFKVCLLRAQCYDHLEEYKKSTIDYETAISLADDETTKIKIRKDLNEVKIKLNRQKATEKNAKGDEQFQLGNYSQAVSFYSAAIHRWPEKPSFYENRCETYMKINDFKRALLDSQSIVDSGSSARKGYTLMSTCHLNLGEYNKADEIIDEMVKNGCNRSVCQRRKILCNHLKTHQKHIDCCLDEKEYQSAIDHIDEAIELLHTSIMLKLLKAECLMRLGDTEGINQIETAEPFPDADRLYLQGLSSYASGNLKKALEHLKDALKADQHHEHAKQMHPKVNRQYAKKLEGDNFLKSDMYHEAIASYTEALNIDISNNNTFVFGILRNRATANSKIESFNDAINDCSRALTIKKNDLKTWLLRAECHQLLDNFAQAIKDFGQILTFEAMSLKKNEKKSKEIRSKIQQLEIEIQHDDARNKKIAGDRFARDLMYESAIVYYGKAIELWPENISFYEALIECCMKSKDFKRVIKECQAALATDNSFIKGYHSMIESFLKLGDLFGAERAIKMCAEHGSKDDRTMIKFKQLYSSLKEYKLKAMAAFEIGTFYAALFEVENALDIAHESTELKLFKAECLVSLERHEEANIIAVSCMQSDPSNADAVYVRALCLYQKDYEQGLECFKNAIRLDPDHKKAKEMIARWKKFQEIRKIADELLQNGRYREASDHFSEALKISPKNNEVIPKLLYNRALAYSQLGVSFIRNAISDCSRLMTTDWTSSKASVLKLRAKCHMQMRNFQRSVEDYQQLVLLDNSNEAKKMLGDAKKALKRFRSNNYYDVLEVDRNASESDIRSSYKRLACIHHPDKHSDAPDDERLEQQEICKRITVAHDVLSDQRKRAEYDRNNQHN